jgi:hypothetical protein
MTQWIDYVIFEATIPGSGVAVIDITKWTIAKLMWSFIKNVWFHETLFQ